MNRSQERSRSAKEHPTMGPQNPDNYSISYPYPVRSPAPTHKGSGAQEQSRSKPMKSYRKHNCETQHRNNHTFLKCALRNINWIHGTGNHAVIAWCNRTITLWHEHDRAQTALDLINADACGHRCRHNHELIYIERGTE